MTTLSVPRDIVDAFHDGESLVCVYCDQEVSDLYCARCMEYKGIMTISEWEEYTGETWE